MFSHENEEFAKRFLDVKEDEVHIIELCTRSLFIMMKKAFQLKEEEIAGIEGRLGKFWKPIPTKKGKDNLEVKTPIEEIWIIVELLLVSTNIELGSEEAGDRRGVSSLKDLEMTKNMTFVLQILNNYVEDALKDKTNAIMTLYSEEMHV